MNGQGKLALCECGKLHFTYGAITVHFEREEFFLFAEAVGRLQRHDQTNGSLVDVEANL